MYRTIGIITVILLVLITSPYWVRQLNKYLFHIPPKKINPLIKVLRLFHKPLGILLLVIAAVHGYMALGSVRLHTGTLAYCGFIITVCMGIAFYKTKKPKLFKWHKICALVSVALVIVHLVSPNLLYYVFR